MPLPISFLLSALATVEVEPNEVGEGVSGEDTGMNWFGNEPGWLPCGHLWAGQMTRKGLSSSEGPGF